MTVSTSGGTPTLPLVLSPQDTVQAQYVSGSGTGVLTFTYVVAPGDLSQGAVTLGSAINLNGSTIEDQYGNSLASSLAQVPALAGVIVDGVPPSLTLVDLTVPYEGVEHLFIPVPGDIGFGPGQLTATVTALPSNGLMLLGDGGTAVTQGEPLTVTQLTSLTFAGGASVASVLLGIATSPEAAAHNTPMFAA